MTKIRFINGIDNYDDLLYFIARYADTQITKKQVEERIEWYRSRTLNNLDDPRCESRGPYKLHGHTFIKPRCALPAGHQGDHLGPDDAKWRNAETPRTGEGQPSKVLGELGEDED